MDSLAKPRPGLAQDMRVAGLLALRGAVVVSRGGVRQTRRRFPVGANWRPAGTALVTAGNCLSGAYARVHGAAAD